MFPKPTDKVGKIIMLPRFERDWLNSHKEVVNFSGLVQEIISQIIELKDPEYYKKYQKNFQTLEIRRLEKTQILLQHISQNI